MYRSFLSKGFLSTAFTVVLRRSSKYVKSRTSRHISIKNFRRCWRRNKKKMFILLTVPTVMSHLLDFLILVSNKSEIFFFCILLTNEIDLSFYLICFPFLIQKTFDFRLNLELFSIKIYTNSSLCDTLINCDIQRFD